jgi:CheY-like chemotaxis protein
MSVLLGEDHAETRSAYEYYLESVGLSVRSASSGPQVLESVRAACPDVLVVDMGLPVLDGWQVTQTLRREPETAELPIIAVTGYTSPEDEKKGMALGCDAFLGKPCLPDQLYAQILRVLAVRWGRAATRGVPSSQAARQRQTFARTRELMAAMERATTQLRDNRTELARALAELKAVTSQTLDPR